MAELAVVIVVGCCPYVPRFLRNVRPCKTGGSGAAEKRFSIPSKPNRKLNTFDKYLSFRSGMTKLELTTSEEQLEMHQYKGVESQKSLSAADDGVTGKLVPIVQKCKIC